MVEWKMTMSTALMLILMTKATMQMMTASTASTLDYRRYGPHDHSDSSYDPDDDSDDSFDPEVLDGFESYKSHGGM